MKTTKENILQNDFTADRDYFETLEDGRRIQILAKGVTVAQAEAVALGVIKPSKKTEEKAEQPTENKKAQPAENKTKGGAK